MPQFSINYKKIFQIVIKIHLKFKQYLLKYAKNFPHIPLIFLFRIFSYIFPKFYKILPQILLSFQKFPKFSKFWIFWVIFNQFFFYFCFRLTKIYKKLDMALAGVDYFANRSWLFEMDGMKRVWHNLSPADRRIFHFDVADIEWKSYMNYIYLGLRFYFVKDGISTLPRARRKFKRYLQNLYSIFLANKKKGT